ncbi:sulfite exporter TauE/SafE family protein [Janthinobacterium agaricidamnosum]|uniref:Putative membrane protein n=1 Tax=Janthinobacterium agaricidamnosum NBRC 102515 = DSM 9628 TaxID=1349767 RepID=W0VFA8_9BURK|nr:sulfite exporter TauE/SafE family protein [Janthinobacterium agaricidamnosum]CDG86037.1 putative membrane protein [Janthinobacterium agaricidamnosum NBRC 102515 = DSM 9628]
MSTLNLLPVFLVGLAGSLHCIGMCGGIVGALSAAPVAATTGGNARPVIAIAVARPAWAGSLARVAAYNLGRIGSYMIAGAAGATLGASLLQIAALQAAGYWLANLMLVALGLYLMDAWRGLARLETAGNLLWNKVRPLMKGLLPMDGPAKALLLGALWGWLPCGMVYSVLLAAMLSGSAIDGAAVMLAFGLGTLPALLAMGLLGARLRRHLQRRAIRLASGLLVLAFGVAGLLRAAHGMLPAWLASLCITGAHP